MHERRARADAADEMAQHHAHLGHYSFSLERTARELGLRHVGGPTGLIAKLESGQPITVAILGASVAENSGCLTQPDKRCMKNGGFKPVVMSWGSPRKRPFKGFSVRFFEWINATWPHPQHQLVNAGRDASTLSTIVPCLFSHIPTSMDLLLIEAGSMFLTNKPYTLEIVTRRVRAMRSPPAVAFVTVHNWCVFGASIKNRVLSHGLLELPHRTYRFYSGMRPGGLNTSVPARVDFPVGTRNPSDEIEQSIDAICERYRVTCISQREAIRAVIARPEWTIREIAGDCLHPVHGTRGTEIMTDLLVHWMLRLVKRHRAAASSRIENELPAPLHPKQTLGSLNQTAACFHLDRPSATNRRQLPWQTASCTVSRGRVEVVTSCKLQGANFSCPLSYTPQQKDSELLPSAWVFCAYAVGSSAQQGKISPGVMGFRPGARLLVPLPTDWLQRSVGGGGGVSFYVTLQYLISWRAMGIARIECAGSCECGAHDLDAHKSFATRNVTIFTERRVLVSVKADYGESGVEGRTAPIRCGFSLTILASTSSGGHAFKLRDVLLYASFESSPCESSRNLHTNRDKMLKLRKRSKLNCADGAEEET